MRRYIIFISVFILFPIQALSQNIQEIKTYKDCVPLTAYIIDNKDSVGENELRQFFLAFSNMECANNVEFREWGNEVLFSMIEVKPIIFFQTLFSLEPNQIEALKNEFNNPIHDGVDIIGKYQIIQGSDMPSNLKNRALDLLQNPYENEIKEIEEWERKNNKKWVRP